MSPGFSLLWLMPPAKNVTLQHPIQKPDAKSRKFVEDRTSQPFEVS
jgi:hypothetical protein